VSSPTPALGRLAGITFAGVGGALLCGRCQPLFIDSVPYDVPMAKHATSGFLTIVHAESVWEYHFVCPVCIQRVAVPISHRPWMIPCPQCKALLNGGEAKVQLLREPVCDGNGMPQIPG
jgi:hypothetical protein